MGIAHDGCDQMSSCLFEEDEQRSVQETDPMSTKRTRGEAAPLAGKKRTQGRTPTMFKDLSAAILCDGNPPSLRALLAPILHSCEAFDAAGNADGTVLCVCEAYFVARSISLQLAATLSSAISGAAPSKMVSKALK